MSTPDDAGCARYEIHIQGKLDEKWLVWLNDTPMTHQQVAGPKPGTLLVCEVVDQARLRGLLNRLWDLNLTLISVKRLDEAAAGIETPGIHLPED